MRFVRSSVTEEIHQEYVKTALAKGLTNFSVLTKHIVRNALIPVVTLTGGQILTGINFGNQQLPSNQPPTLNNINKSGDEDKPINFSQTDFTSAFNDADGNTLVKIEITALPNNGVLQLNNTAIALNQEIAVSDLNNLTFSPNTNFNGNITFSWNGFDGSVYADNAATVNITVNPVDDAPKLTI